MSGHISVKVTTLRKISKNYSKNEGKMKYVVIIGSKGS
jgi:hypothetical protein